MSNLRIMSKIVIPANVEGIKKFILHFSYTICIESWWDRRKLRQEHFGF
jgi:hypothetical protein